MGPIFDLIGIYYRARRTRPYPESPIDHPVPTQESPRRMTTTATASRER